MSLVGGMKGDPSTIMIVALPQRSFLMFSFSFLLFLFLETVFPSFQANFCPFLSDFKIVGFSISKSLVLIGIGQRSRRYKIFGQGMHTS